MHLRLQTADGQPVWWPLGEVRKSIAAGLDMKHLRLHVRLANGQVVWRSLKELQRQMAGGLVREDLVITTCQGRSTEHELVEIGVDDLQMGIATRNSMIL